MKYEDALIIAPDAPTEHAVTVPVLRVFDGDGFLTRVSSCFLQDDLFGTPEFEITARFGFIDAPEVEQPGGTEAKAFLSSLIGGREVWIDILTKMDTGRSVDRYGRIVCVPYLEQHYSSSIFEDPNNKTHRTHCARESIAIFRNIELEMVLNGWAWVLDRYGPDERYFDALEDARKQKRGIWAYDNNIHPWEFKKQKAQARRRNHGASEPAAAICCPKQGCNGNLVERSGRFGGFLGCSNFPKCRYSRSLIANDP